MKTTASKEISTSSQSSQAFFNKKGEGSFFSSLQDNKEPFFTPIKAQSQKNNNKPEQPIKQKPDSEVDEIDQLMYDSGTERILSSLGTNKPKLLINRAEYIFNNLNNEHFFSFDNDPPLNILLNTYKVLKYYERVSPRDANGQLMFEVGWGETPLGKDSRLEYWSEESIVKEVEDIFPFSHENVRIWKEEASKPTSQESLSKLDRPDNLPINGDSTNTTNAGFNYANNNGGVSKVERRDSIIVNLIRILEMGYSGDGLNTTFAYALSKITYPKASVDRCKDIVENEAWSSNWNWNVPLEKFQELEGKEFGILLQKRLLIHLPEKYGIKFRSDIQAKLNDIEDAQTDQLDATGEFPVWVERMKDYSLEEKEAFCKQRMIDYKKSSGKGTPGKVTKSGLMFIGASPWPHPSYKSELMYGQLYLTSDGRILDAEMRNLALTAGVIKGVVSSSGAVNLANAGLWFGLQIFGSSLVSSGLTGVKALLADTAVSEGLSLTESGFDIDKYFEDKKTFTGAVGTALPFVVYGLGKLKWHDEFSESASLSEPVSKATPTHKPDAPPKSSMRDMSEEELCGVRGCGPRPRRPTEETPSTERGTPNQEQNVPPSSGSGRSIRPFEERVTFGAVDEYGRASYVVGEIHQTDLHKGSATGRTYPPGIGPGEVSTPDRRSNLPEAGPVEPQYPAQRGHLLGDLFGGKGTDSRNLAWMHTKINLSRFKVEFENPVRTALERGESVSFSVQPLYRPGEAAPYSIEVWARSSSGETIVPHKTILTPGLSDVPLPITPPPR
ncbi:MAG: DNA/RNA non-specific endonuclease [Saprospiraceae bacterium]|nr:DNA/RNA non-specific endonuclease [Saprospiraceae bacterium]